ncbi:neuroglobin-like [Mizuhopecten yessoensis]|uniref:Neuroglobin n=1 Tax=Mizuhopecten yessoensis TaxID=6573 RepID=A0A210QIU4_MIZYE|nr:neuroglobin-like [Mizuhopecten yessoensis]OWF48660.1 Neuroglobin [Mizuhopecten yessoensis]
MGCSQSGSVRMQRSSQQLENYLTSEQVRLVKQSWLILGEDMAATGLLVFKKLFESNEGMKKLFYKLMRCDSSEQLEFDQEKLTRHATIVMQGLGAAVESLEDSVFLTNVLIAMGERHAMYNVKTEMVPHLWPAIRDAFKELMGEDFLPAVESAWLHVFEYIGSKFKMGIVSGKQ